MEYPDDATALPLPYLYAKQHGVARIGEQFYCRMTVSAEALLEAQRVAGRISEVVQLSEAEFDERLSAAYGHQSGASQQIMSDLSSGIDLLSLSEDLPDNEDLLASDEHSPIIRLINAVLAEAVKEGASDIHIETFERSLSIRFRVDGVLRQILQPARKLAPFIVSRIKVMARLDIAEKRLPQDGRISLTLGHRAIDIRVSTIPAQYGERVVMRLLDKNNLCLSVDQLGLSPADQHTLTSLIAKPHGILLVTGPTGSGKSTTLYALLAALNNHERNILTVEDPIEYELEGIGQTQVNPRVEMTFALGLRAILRQDPDVVMVGEIRDNETAQIAVQASLTGHLVMSTLHTNSAVGAITRLRDMGLEPFLLASSLLGVVAQRLVRRLCPTCAQQVPLPAAQAPLFAFLPAPPPHIYQAVGCPSCRFTGYRGRAAIHECLTVDNALRQAIYQNQDELGIEKIVRGSSRSLRENGLLKAITGDTTVEEVLRVTTEQDGAAGEAI